MSNINAKMKECATVVSLMLQYFIFTCESDLQTYAAPDEEIHSSHCRISLAGADVTTDLGQASNAVGTWSFRAQISRIERL